MKFVRVEEQGPTLRFLFVAQNVTQNVPNVLNDESKSERPSGGGAPSSPGQKVSEAVLACIQNEVRSGSDTWDCGDFGTVTRATMDGLETTLGTDLVRL